MFTRDIFVVKYDYFSTKIWNLSQNMESTCIKLFDLSHCFQFVAIYANLCQFMPNLLFPPPSFQNSKIGNWKKIGINRLPSPQSTHPLQAPPDALFTTSSASRCPSGRNSDMKSLLPPPLNRFLKCKVELNIWKYV